MEWGVATDAPDGSATYLHVLKPPKGKTLRIGMPANGERFANAALLPSGKPARLDFADAGYVVTLPEGESWAALDTVIRLEVSAKNQRR